MTVEATQSQLTISLSSEDEFEDFEIIVSTQSLENQSSNMAQNSVVKMPGSVKVKAVLLQSPGVEGSSPEVRRFIISDITYNGLLTSVQSAFNAISSQCQQHYTLFWKDEDCDLVKFSSTEEFHHAIGYMVDDTLRVYVTITRDDTLDEETAKAFPPSFIMNMHCGRKRKGMEEKCRQKKAVADSAKNEEFKTVRQQVPAEFRSWVRQYVRTWFLQGAEAANNIDNLPDGAPPQFQLWLHDSLTSWSQQHTGKVDSGSGREMRMEEGSTEEEKRDMFATLEGLPPVYHQWLRLFLPRFYQNQISTVCANKFKEGRHSLAAGPRCPHGRHGGWHGKHAEHNRQKGKRGGHQSSASESEDTDGAEKMWKKVPKEFRKYVRITVLKLHKDKADTSKAKEKPCQTSLSPEVVDFVPQILLEWHAKLSQNPPNTVAMEMMKAERTLPSGLEREHFLWMCRFMARWHRRNAGKCDRMSGWSSGETGEDTSGEEGLGEGFGPCYRGHLRAAMRAMRRQQQGMVVTPPHPFAMRSGMGPGGCFLSPHPGMYSCCRHSRKMSTGDKSGCSMMSFGLHEAKRCCKKNKTQGCTRQKCQNGTTSDQVDLPLDEAVENVTNRVKKI